MEKTTKVELARPIHEGIEFGVGLMIVYIVYRLVLGMIKIGLGM